ncbi:Mov34/MPN/PAD-1 family protein [Mycobacterium sp. CVI_P3]|uniref:Mov34/MPN/PAD-1 family protein n=1 Tax=Mycobacterium pinniadriaticum TaxID=2994102 RepID=A0ABT3SPD9_9MYCO|nr:Mov34/MPN/PAD-1 family protein [Mycobacterium pinniadriaticum]MCX2934982.1 Mov34/MPN/PAD-1 family protein [Mycobacterium pinniadriaticum]MCX2941404.1 Mov34/MPN/PAD-1 family protein [Mycobacterium pinniadriaticum]
MTVHRRTPLPTATARGQLLVAEQILAPTTRSLRASSGADGPHEGLVLWLGRTVGATTLALSIVCPPARTGRSHVLVDEHAVALAARSARRYGLGVVAQVHSHPGHDTRHSDGDDHLVLMPFPDMFSLVVADYGRGDLHPSRGAGLHQYQDGRWVQVIDDDAMTVVPASTSHANTGRSVQPR